MHRDDLKTIWLCRQCGRKLIFHSDVEDHRRLFGHMKMMLCNLPADGEMPEMFTRGRLSLGFWLNGSVARLVVEYEYYPASGAIRYVDVRYTDSQLQSRVENDRAMMKNIDNYLRRMLKQEQSA